jgi:type I restriction enzyme R subunit
LKQTFSGSIYLSDKAAVYDASKITPNNGPKDEEKSPLDEIIERINQTYKGEFTQGDRVVANDLFDRMSKDDKLKAAAQTSDPKIFAESVFPKAFDQVATDSYMDAQDAYTGLFEDKAKYKAFMGVMAEMMYKFFRNINQ